MAKRIARRTLVFLIMIAVFTPLLANTSSVLAANNGYDFGGYKSTVFVGDGEQYDGYSNITIQARVKLNNLDTSTTDNQPVIYKIGSGGYALEYYANDDKWRFVINVDGSYKRVVSNDTVNKNKWYTLTGVYDGKQLKFYVDGVLQKDVLDAKGVVKSNKHVPLTIGGSRNSSEQELDGSISDVKIWDTALSANQVQSTNPASDKLQGDWSLSDLDSLNVKNMKGDTDGNIKFNNTADIKITKEVGTYNKAMEWKEQIEKPFPQSSIGNYDSELDYSEDGYEGKLKATKIILTPKNRYKDRSITLKESWTDSTYRFRLSEAPIPDSMRSTYTDSETGFKIDEKLPKKGKPYSVAEAKRTITSISSGKAENYDKDGHSKLGYMSPEKERYWSYTLRFDDPKPRPPSDYYGPDGDEFGWTGWTLVDYRWDESSVQDAKASKWAYKTKNDGYMWTTDSGLKQRYRKGVWLKYEKKVPGYKYRQDYEKKFSLPDTASKWKVEVVYEGQVKGTNLETKDLSFKDQSGEDVDHLTKGNDYKVELDITNNGATKINGKTDIEFFINDQKLETQSLSLNMSPNGNQHIVFPFKADKRGDNKYRVVLNNNRTITEITYLDNSSESNIYTNTKPEAGFTVNPNPTDRLTTTKFTTKARDEDGDTLTYTYDVRKKGTNEWERFSTDANPSYKFNEIGEYEVKQTVKDKYGLTDSVQQIVKVENIAPKADFTINPNPTDRLTETKFTTKASDPENDKLTYKYEIRKKGESSWKQISTNASPTYKFPEVATYEVRQTVTDVHGASHNIVKEVKVENIAPKADFTINPNPTDRLTDTKFTTKASDPENDKLTYKYEIRKKGESSWKQISASASPAYKFPEVATYEVRQTVTDVHGASHNIVKEVKVENIAPKADFTINPNPTDRLTDTKFTTKASDPENDKLIYKYEIRKKGESSWKQISTSASPTYKFPEVATYEVRQTVTDEYGATNSITKEVKVQNLAPDLTVPSLEGLFEGDDTVLKFNLTDPENDTLSFELKEKVDGQWESVKKINSGIKSGSNVEYKMQNLEARKYEFEAVVTDEYGAKKSKTFSFVVKPLEVKGQVTHTPNWLEIHKQQGNSEDMFYSGEKFILGATGTNHDLKSIKVNFSGNQIDNNVLKMNDTLTYQSTKDSLQVHSGELYQTSMADPATRLKNGKVTFLFTAEWANGVVKYDTVQVEIIDTAYNSFDFNRTN